MVCPTKVIRITNNTADGNDSLQNKKKMSLSSSHHEVTLFRSVFQRRNLPWELSSSLRAFPIHEVKFTATAISQYSSTAIIHKKDQLKCYLWKSQLQTRFVKISLSKFQPASYWQGNNAKDKVRCTDVKQREVAFVNVIYSLYFSA